MLDTRYWIGYWMLDIRQKNQDWFENYFTELSGIVVV
jgi:hypothetical protein